MNMHLTWKFEVNRARSVCYCDRKSRAACAQSFALWQQATIEITRRNHSIAVCSGHVYILWHCRFCDRKSRATSAQSFALWQQATIESTRRDHSSSFFWASSFIHCLASLDFRAGVEQPFGCLIVQNHQAVQSVGRSINWTLEDDMVDGLFCATLTGRRGGPSPFVPAGAKTPDTGAEGVKSDPGSSWEGHSGCVCTGIWNWSAESCGVVRPLRVPLMIRPLRRTYVVVVREADELLCGGYKWVSRFEAPCNSTCLAYTQ